MLGEERRGGHNKSTDITGPVLPSPVHVETGPSYMVVKVLVGNNILPR